MILKQNPDFSRLVYCAVLGLLYHGYAISVTWCRVCALSCSEGGVLEAKPKLLLHPDTSTHLYKSRVGVGR